MTQSNKATKKATVEAYMDLLKEGDGNKLTAFINECFGIDEEFNHEECDAFAKEVEGPATKYIKDQYMNVPEATKEMMPTAEQVEGNTAEVAVEATPAEAQEEVVNTEEAPALVAADTEAS
jgi:hypothetical protein